VRYADRRAQKAWVALDIEDLPDGFTFLQGRATDVVPALVAKWLDEAAKGV
jgi:NAD-dependent deacetylase